MYMVKISPNMNDLDFRKFVFIFRAIKELLKIWS